MIEGKVVSTALLLLAALLSVPAMDLAAAEATPAAEPGQRVALLNGVPCGDGNLDTDEECDDSNQVDGDGCQSNCIFPLASEGDFSSDDFNSCSLDPTWTPIDGFGLGSIMPVGGGTGDAHLELTLPNGTAYNAWGAAGNESLRVMQPVVDSDLEIEARFAAEPTGNFNDQGIIVEQDPANWLRFDTYNDGANLHAFIGRTTEGGNNVHLNLLIPPGSATYLRVTRNGDEFTLWYSSDGTSWTPAGSMSWGLTVTSVGVFAGNPVSGAAYTSQVDYFFNVAAPIAPEDGSPVCDDGDACTDDSCDPPSGTCVNTPNFDDTTDCCDPGTGTTSDRLDDDGDGADTCDPDCDDGDPALNLDDVDGDGASTCDGDCDDGDPALNLDDVDGDGVDTCAGDCDDGNAVLNLDDTDGDGASTCDGDCDDGDPALNIDDADGDGADTCEGDCDDADAALNLDDLDGDGADTCAGDCDDGDAALNLIDADIDGVNTCDGDCDDTRGSVFPGAPERCDTLDNDCDGTVDEGCICGDNVVSAGEECDDGNNLPGDGCRPDCTWEICGDGILDLGEGCDDGNTADGDGCSANCQRESRCGDDNVDAGEQCDDGNTVGGDGCSANCQWEPRCGDNNVDAGEQCDDGNTADGDGCSATCQREARCGDGVVDPGEICDDGNNDNGDFCMADCTPASCVINGDFEAPSRNPWKFFSNGAAKFQVINGEARITINAVGNNVQLLQRNIMLKGDTEYELSFMGWNSGGRDVQMRLIREGRLGHSYGLKQVVNLKRSPETHTIRFRTTPGDKYDARLLFWLAPFDKVGDVYHFDDVVLRRLDDRPATCGNGSLDAGEECDDSGPSASCDDDCTWAVCGDNRINGVAGEQCDDGNDIDDDRCDNSCHEVTNLVNNGNFEPDAAGWQFYTNGVGKFQVINGEARIKITAVGTNVQLLQKPLALKGDTEYELTFRGWNTGGRDVQMRLIKDRYLGHSYGLRQNVDLKRTYEMHTIRFRTTPGDKTDARLVFWLAPFDKAGDTYYFDDVMLREVP